MAYRTSSNQDRILLAPTGWQFSGPKFTISAWMYWQSSPFGYKMIAGKYPGQGAQRLRFYVDPTDRLLLRANFNVSYSGADTIAHVDANGWHHVFFSGDGDDGKISIDGAIRPYSGLGNGGMNDSTVVQLGLGGSDDNSEYWTGWLAEVAMWDYGIFTDSQIEALARGVNPIKVSNTSVVGYWPLRGTTLPMADLSGRGRHLTEFTSGVDFYTDPSFHPPVQMAMV